MVTLSESGEEVSTTPDVTPWKVPSKRQCRIISQACNKRLGIENGRHTFLYGNRTRKKVVDETTKRAK